MSGRIDRNTQLAQKIVVIDDPMTSLDEHRALTTIHEISDLVNKVEQVIILSHSKPFLCQIWEGADKSNRSALKIVRSNQSSLIDEWDVHQDCITEHDKRYRLINKYIHARTLTGERDVATALRFILEAYLRVAYPLSFPPGTLLGSFCNQCQQAMGTAEEFINDSDIKELRRLMDYANKFHHDTNPAYATQIVNDHELLNFSKRTIKFIQRPLK